MSLGNWEGCVFDEPKPEELPGVRRSCTSPRWCGVISPAMNRRKFILKKQTKIILGVVALVAVVAILLGVYFGTRPDTTEGAKALTITVVHGDDSQNVFEIHTDAEYLDAALTENDIASGEDSEYGLFITTVDGETANSDNEEWWCITQDGEMLMTGASETPINDGDSYELTLTVGY
jgi:hypothetical protein